MIAVLLIGMLGTQASAPPTPEPTPKMRADHVVVVKSRRMLTLLSNGKAIRTYKVALGGSPIGPKERQGDHKTPEGRYVLDRRNARSQFYKSIHVSYPNAQDRQRAAKHHVSPGGDIMIHVYRMAWDRWAPPIALRTGRMDVLQ